MESLPESSEKIDCILAALLLAKHEMGCSVKKDAVNPFHKSGYASLKAHLELCDDVLAKHDMIFLHTMNIIGGQSVLVATIRHVPSGEWIRSYLPLINAKNDCQGLGSSITYMRRYSINAMLGLVADDDDGEKGCGRDKDKKEPEKNVQVLSLEQVKEIAALVNQFDQESKKDFYKIIKNEYGTELIEKLPTTAFNRCIKALQARLKLEKK